jgi:hypothetical protein
VPQVIPVQPGDAVGSADYRLGATVEGEDYVFELHWCRRDDRWYLSISELSGAPVVSGCKVVLGVLIGRRSAHPLFRLGGFVAIDLASTGLGRGVEAGSSDLGRRVALRWYSTEELAAIAGYS